MSETTTIVIHKDLKSRLDEAKLHPRETYNEVIERLLECSVDDEPLSEEALCAIEEGLEDIRKGRTIPMEEVMKELGIE
jgi:predicted transcriptional regulator